MGTEVKVNSDDTIASENTFESFFSDDFSKFDFPMEMYLRFDNFFEQLDNGSFVLRQDAPFRFFVETNAWVLTIENDGMSIEDFKKQMLDMVVGYQGNSVSVDEFEKMFLDWKNEMRSNKNGN